MKLGLSDEQKAERLLRLHAGDAADIMAGDYRKVWARFQPGYEDDDLSGEFRVQLGSYTEPFNLAWTMQQTGRHIDYYSANPLMLYVWTSLVGKAGNTTELVVSKRHPFMAANLDGMTDDARGARSVIDAKHVGRLERGEVLRYTPQSAWLHVARNSIGGCLSIFIGNKWETPV